MQNIYPNLMIKMLLGNIKKIYIFFPDFGCMNKLCAYAYVHATFLSFIRVTFCC